MTILMSYILVTYLLINKILMTYLMMTSHITYNLVINLISYIAGKAFDLFTDDRPYDLYTYGRPYKHN